MCCLSRMLYEHQRKCLCDIEVSDGLYSMVVGYGEAVSTSYVYVNKGKAISVDVPAYILNHKPHK